ncbi:hypothetical protein MTO96_035459 [Rhipicephalus appendiculatus]
MLRQEEEVVENLAHLEKLLGQLGQPSNIFGAESTPIEEVSDDFLVVVVVTEEERNDIAKRTGLQSGCPLWHCARAFRISVSSKAHRIKIRQGDFQSLAVQLTMPQSFKSAACAYGIANEPVARKEYQSKTGRKVIQVGLVISTAQPWLCCSPDGLIDDEQEIRLLEIKAPYRCQTRPVVDQDINVDYLYFNGQTLQLRESHVYYTQVQVGITFYIFKALPDVIREMSKVFMKRSFLSTDKASWGNTTNAKYADVEKCMFDFYEDTLRDLKFEVVEKSMEDLLESLLAESMMFRPLQEMYTLIKARISNTDVGFWERGFGRYRELHLFYFFLIESQCESFRQQAVTKEVLIQQGVPGRIILNRSISIFKEFADAFNCNATDPMSNYTKFNCSPYEDKGTGNLPGILF